VSGARDARLFAAAELAPELALRLAGWARQVAGELGPGRAGAGLRVLEPGSLHLTLCFLGSRPAEQIEELVSALAEACEGAPELELSIGAPIWLPPRRPGSLAVEVHDPSGELRDLQEKLERALTGAGPARRYRPHVTVARLRAGAARPARIVLAPTPAVRFTARRVALVRSWLEPHGARYELQGAVTLAPTLP